MTDNNEKDQSQDKDSSKNSEKTQNDRVSVEEKLKETEDKLLRSLAEIENQRRRFEKEIKDAFEFGSFNLLVIINRQLISLQKIFRGSRFAPWASPCFALIKLT